MEMCLPGREGVLVVDDCASWLFRSNERCRRRNVLTKRAIISNDGGLPSRAAFVMTASADQPRLPSSRLHVDLDRTTVRANRIDAT